MNILKLYYLNYYHYLCFSVREILNNFVYNSVVDVYYCNKNIF